MAWLGGFKGDSYDRVGFRAWLREQKKPSFMSFLTVHATGAPYTLAAVGGKQRMLNLAAYYKRKWKGGPHTFVMEDRVYPGTPIHLASVHSPSWNNISIASESEGLYDGKKHSHLTGKGKLAWETMAWQTAEILDWMDWAIDAKHIAFHRDDKATTHKVCPSPPSLITKDWFIKMVLAADGQAVPAVLPTPTSSKTLLVDTPGDTLNFRNAKNGKVIAKLNDRQKVTLIKYDGAWAHVQTPLGYKGWVFSKYLRDATTPVPAPVPVFPPPQPDPTPVAQPFQPGSFRAREYGIGWLKKFEGLGPINKVTGLTEAYWDINDWAVGHGHNNGSGIPPAVKKGDAITVAEADRILRECDLPPVEKYLNFYVKTPLHQWQIDALIWHIYQQGPGNFRNGKVLPLVNAGKHEEAANTIGAWPTSNKGLQRRRGVEAARYRGGEPTKW